MTILVTGATGNIGRKVVDELVARGVTDIRALTNDPAKAALPSGVEAFCGFIGKPETLDGAFEGVTGMYLAPYEPTAAEVLQRAKDAGVQYVVATSGSAHWQALTDTILASGIDVTVLGPGEFMENFAGWAGQVSGGVVREPYPDAGSAPIAMQDIAAVAAALLAADERAPHVGKVYELTGPSFLTRVDMAAQIGEGIGREVAFEQISREEAEEALRPEMGDMASWYLDLQDASRRYRQEANSLVEELSGRPPMSLAQWAERNRSLFGA
ncbi:MULTISPECIES: SDR family oxidoreductase [Tsukamurella]|uniref:Hydroxylase n=2 Tax=Tsukamurella TaxID=2060 RepID=A0A5C5S8Q8_9ACTN|nr:MULTISPECIES: NAD(P)H-binding protein [Tsukamurella]NMD57505.1 NAD(P)H-binding protein [Tsukamurella columbiensis]TWS30913.1 hydroxylase [Tsukamurella conjunctivitidis]